MANEDWSSLPSIIIVDILSYLDLSEKLSVTTVCRRWRSCICHPSLWKDQALRLKIGTRKKKANLTDVCSKFVQEVTIEFQTRNAFMMRDFISYLDSISENPNLQSFVLKPSSFHVEWPERMGEDPREVVVNSMKSVIKSSRKLRNISFGCIADLMDHSDELLSCLAKHHAKTLETLHISSVKEDPDSYGLIDLPLEPFASFSNLQVLGIDYDYLNNYMLLSFCNNNRIVQLQKLVINVHGIEPEHEKITNATWRHLTNANPSLEVTLNLIHSVDGACGILDILQPAMPLAYLRMFFCQYLNIAGIDFIAQHMSHSLKSMYILDGMASYQEPNVFEYNTDENPFVMLAWKCTNLTDFTLIGYEMDRDDIIAMARLRGNKLERFVIPSCCVTDVEENRWGICVNVGCVDEQLLFEVSKNLGRDWTPIDYGDIPKAVLDSKADCETAYLEMLLRDQD